MYCIEINRILKLSHCLNYWSVNAPGRSARSRPLAAARLAPPLRRAHAPMNCHLYHGDAGEETANKTIIIMCITTLMFNKCILVTNIVVFFYHRPQAHGFNMIL